LRNMGIRLALDDFGTGFSSLNYLDRFQVDTLKVDRSFVTKMVESPRTQVLAEAIFSIGRGLGLELVAEGVETREQLLTVTSRGAQLIQGFLTGRPCLPEELQARLLLQQEQVPEFPEEVDTITATLAENTDNGACESATVLKNEPLTHVDVA
jgi:EAL domain-containing protein (putative c-di-GMP-specific phosphodiesterase class I)